MFPVQVRALVRLYRLR